MGDGVAVFSAVPRLFQLVKDPLRRR